MTKKRSFFGIPSMKRLGVILNEEEIMDTNKTEETFIPPCRGCKTPGAGTTPAPKTDDELRALIERECGPVQRIGDMLWAVEVARAVERAHGICADG